MQAQVCVYQHIGSIQTVQSFKYVQYVSVSVQRMCMCAYVNMLLVKTRVRVNNTI